MYRNNDASKDAEDTRGKYEVLNGKTATVNVDDSGTKCGCGPYKPKWLQRIVGPKLFTVHAGSLLAVYFGMSSYLSGILTTIERQFELSSSEVAGLTVTNDVAILCLVIFVAYYGHASHRPRWLAGGGLIIALGFLICTIPHFISDPIDPRTIIVGGSGRRVYSRGASRSAVCNTPRNYLADQLQPILLNPNATDQSLVANDTANIAQGAGDIEKTFERYNGTNNCKGVTSHGLGLVTWLVIGQIIVGCGAAPIFPLLISYLDDSVRKHELTSYTAVLFIAATLGPMAGLMLSSKATSLYVDFDRVDANLIPDIPQYDPRWIGAWWLGFLASSALLVIFSIPMFFYPKRMPKPTDMAETENKYTDEDRNMNALTGLFKKKSTDDGFIESIKGIIKTVKRLVFNLSLILMVLGGSAEMATGVIGRTFGVKYMINQFGISPRKATLLVGGIFIPCVTSGQVVSAFICRRFKLNTKQSVIFILVALVLSLVTVPLKMFIGCPNSPTAGVNVPYAESSTTTRSSIDFKDIEQTNLSTCNADCACPEEIFRPVCGANGVTYISPCHAGCLKLNSTEIAPAKAFRSKKTYSQCKCVASTKDSMSVSNPDTAVSGQCRGNCDTSRKLTIYIVLGAFSVFFMSLVHNPLTFINLRIVDAKDRSVAVGFKSLINKCFAFFPAPVYMGAIINSTCLYWQHTCGARGACWLYNIVAYRYAFFGTITVLQTVGIICYAAMYFSIKEPKTTTVQKLHEREAEPNEETKIELTTELNTKVTAK